MLSLFIFFCFVFFFFQAEDGIRDLYVTGVQTCALPISWYLTGDRNAEIYTTSAVFKTVADAKADQAAVGQRTAALCEAQDVAGSNASVGSLKQLTLPKIGDTARSFRATIPSPGNPTINVDLVVIRVARVVITLHVISLGSANTLEVKVARALARRAR